MKTKDVEIIDDVLAAQVHNVSRSFSFVIDQLPKALRREVQVAYLLFRMGDNIEDTAALSPEEKSRLLSGLLDAFAEGRPYSPQLELSKSDQWTDLTEGEHELMKVCDSVIMAFSSLQSSAKKSLLQQAEIMFKGMAEIQRDYRLDGYVSLPDTDALEKYCYYVAGTVGDYLTDRFLERMPELDVKNRAQMLGSSRAFALVLQVTNILRDVRDDHEHGHIFYPRSLFADFSAPGLLDKDSRVHVLEAGRKMVSWLLPSVRLATAYIPAIPKSEPSLRLFCTIPYVMAIKTITMSALNPDVFGAKSVKMSRWQTRKTVATSKIMCRSNAALRRWFQGLITDLEHKVA